MPLVVRRAVLLHGADDAPGVEEPEQLTWQTSHVMFCKTANMKKVQDMMFAFLQYMRCVLL